jgi:hypothetical protein
LILLSLADNINENEKTQEENITGIFY